MPRRVLIMGAAGRDFHNFNTVYREDADVEVVAFTATQIPFINDRKYPAELAGPHYPNGIPIHDESELVELIDDARRRRRRVRVLRRLPRVRDAQGQRGAGGRGELRRSSGRTRRCSTRDVPVVSVCAVRTGSGKSQTTRAIAGVLKDAGKRVVAVRHPMPYGDLNAQRVQRYATLEDLDRYDTTIEEREEYEPHIASGTIIYAGVDYADILAQAQAECDVLLWDGGNNDLPFYRPTVSVVVADPLRAGHETTYHPGETNIRMADVIVINKVDSATPEQLAELRRDDRARSTRTRPSCGRTAGSRSTSPDSIAGKRVLVIEDGPTLTHGDMKYGAGVVAARQHGAAEIVDPRPWALGTIEETFRKYDVGPVLPAMGYSEGQLAEMEKIIDAAEVDMVVIGTPIDLRRVIDDLEAGRARPLRPGRAARLAVAHRRPGAGARGLTRTGARRPTVERVVIALGGNALLRRGAEDTFEEMYRASRVGRGADRRHRRLGVGGRRHPRQRSAGRTDPAAAGGRERRRASDAARRLRCREPGPDRVPAPGHDRRRLLRTRDGAPGRHDPDAHPCARPRIPRSASPTKFVGPFYEEREARRLEAERGYVMKADPHGGWRRVVPSPEAVLDRRDAGRSSGWWPTGRS